MDLVATLYVPAGVFLAEQEWTNERIAAIGFVEKRGKELIARHPEIAETYRKFPNLCYEDLAVMYMGGEAEAHPGVARKAVGYALKRLMSQEELAILTHNKRRDLLEIRTGGYDSEKFIERCRKAWQRKKELGQMNNPEAMTRGRGFIPWSKEERAFALSKLNSTRNNYDEVAQQTNAQFNANRTGKTVYDMVRYESRRKNN